MQNRYTGDIGDYAKYGLLRALLPGRRLGVAWYLVPDETHNNDGRHIDYLDRPEKWRKHDPELFDDLRRIIQQDRRTVADVEHSRLLHGATFACEPLKAPPGLDDNDRKRWRNEWFRRVLGKLTHCDLVFADPDNGLCLDETFRKSRTKRTKRIPLAEVDALANGRTAVVYHHNTRFPGGHERETAYWLSKLGTDSAAIRWRRWSSRTFFVIRPTGEVSERLIAFARQWEDHAHLVSSPS